MEFLTHLFKQGLHYSALNTARSALSAFLKVDGKQVGEHPLVCRFLKGVFNLRPSLPKTNVTWDPNCVLRFIRGWSPVKSLTLKRLSLKVATLLTLLTSQRGQSIHLIDVRNLDLNPHRIKIRFGDVLKTTRPGFHQHELTIKAFAPDRRLCICVVLKEYLDRTKELRGTATPLLLSYVKPFRPISRDTLSRWLKVVLKLAGVDLSIFTPHSIRAAASSSASSSKVPIATIMKTAGWSRAETFASYYKKEIIHEGKLGEVLLKKV